MPRTQTGLREWTPHHALALIGFIGTLLLAALPASASDQQEIWSALRTGKAFAMMRHAIAPGTGDPQHFTIGDCSTQRNLSDQGRMQARRIGEQFRRNGLSDAEVYASQWCRSHDTATLLRLGGVSPLPPLNSFFSKMERRTEQTQALRRWLTARKSSRPLVLVTHQVNIAALTGTYAGSGETVVATLGDAGRITVLGTIK
jgi:8-oxo-(d)GTP phosphatase